MENKLQNELYAIILAEFSTQGEGEETTVTFTYAQVEALLSILEPSD